jgi:hypothetical protein
MIQLLRSMFAATPREKSLKKPAPTAGSARLNAGGNYRAVSLEPCPKCPAAAEYGGGKRYLLREMPRLPLANCAMSANCSCKFHKHSDRRDGDRRLLGEVTTTRWYTDSERRDRKCRRSVDH